MCDLARGRSKPVLIGLFGLLLVLSSASPVGALPQSAESYRARVDTLLLLWRQALEAEADMRPGVDTVVAGGLRLLTWPRNRELVRDAAELALIELRRDLGADTVLLDRLSILLLFAGDPMPRLDFGGSALHVGNEAPVEPPDLSKLLVDRVSRDLAALADEKLALWLGGLLPLGPPSRAELQAAYTDLATSDSRVARRCLAGRLRACADALAVHELVDPIRVWYAPEERRRLVERRGVWRGGGAGRRARDCTEGAADHACLALLRGIQERALWPIPPRSHRLLARFALDLKGPSAYTRLVDARHPAIAARLSHAAGVELDSLVAEWRASVLSASPGRGPVSLPVAVTALAWTLVFAVAAARSTRWRRP